MSSIFSRIIKGELPGRFVWKDDLCVGILTASPLKPGHTLLIPRVEVDHWLDLPPDLATHLILTSQKIGQAIQQGFHPVKVGLIIAGLEVRHVHLHLIPINQITDLDFAHQNRNPDPVELDHAATVIRASLQALNYPYGVNGV